MRRQLPSLTSLRNFEAVARHLSFTNAANELCVTQGAVSHQVKLLETELGTKLLLRGGPHVELTEAGKKLLQVAYGAFNELAQATSEIRIDSQKSKEPLRIRVTPQFSEFWLAPRLTRFLSAYPNIDIYISRLTLETIKKPIGDAITIIPDTEHSLEDGEDLLFRSDLMPLCSPSFEGGEARTTDLKAIDRATLLCETSHDWWSEWCHRCRPDKPLLGSRVYFDDPTMAVHVAMAGQGYFMGSPTLLNSFIKSGRLLAPLGPKKSVPRGYYLNQKSGMKRKTVAKSFRSWILDEAHSDRASPAIG